MEIPPHQQLQRSPGSGGPSHQTIQRSPGSGGPSHQQLQRSPGSGGPPHQQIQRSPGSGGPPHQQLQRSPGSGGPPHQQLQLQRSPSRGSGSGSTSRGSGSGSPSRGSGSGSPPPPPPPHQQQQPLLVRYMLAYLNLMAMKQKHLVVSATIVATLCVSQFAMPAGGTWQDTSRNHRAGQPIMATEEPILYRHYMLTNVIGTVVSIMIMLLGSAGLPRRVIALRAMPSAGWRFMQIALLTVTVFLLCIIVSIASAMPLFVSLYCLWMMRESVGIESLKWLTTYMFVFLLFGCFLFMAMVSFYTFCTQGD